MKPFRLLSLFLCLCPLAVYAQTAEVGGAVQDPSGAVIPKASVEFRNQDTGIRRQATTNGDGIYHIAGVDPGKYDATVQAKGFKTLTRENITFQVGDKAQIDFKMQVGQASQSVTVDGSGQQINTTDASVNTVIDRQFVANIPLNGRSFQSLMTLAPGVSQVPVYEGVGTGASGEITVNGQRTEANYFTVDGVSANTGVNGGVVGSGAGFSGSVAGETALGTTQSLVSIDALQEFRAITSTYSAEYGRSPGGQFSFVTRSGTNEFHGLAFDYFRNEALDASNWFNGYTNDPPLPKAAERQNDFGGTFGGPLRIPHIYDGRNRTFFFFSYEGLRLQTPQTIVAQQYPDLCLRGIESQCEGGDNPAPTALQPLLTPFPVPNGTDLGNGLGLFNSSYSNPSELDSISIRLDQTVNTKLHLFGRYSHAPSNSGIRQSTDLANTEISIQDVNAVTAGMTYALTPKLSDELRFNYTHNNGGSNWTTDTFGGAQPFNISALDLPQYSFVGPTFLWGEASGFTVGPAANVQTQFNVVDSLGLIVGKHALKLGIDYRRLATQAHPNAVEIEPIYFELSSVQNNAADFILVLNNPIQTEPIYTNFSAFAQDEWKATSRLALSLGVRWELNPPPGDGYGNIPYTLNQIDNLATAVVAPKGTPLWQTTHDNFAPRLGMAYIANNHPGRETVMRTGIGIFFDPGNEQASAGLAGVGYQSSSDLFSAAYPLASSEWRLPAPSVAPPYSGGVSAYDPHLKLPFVTQWNMALEQSLGSNQTFLLNYVASAGRRMLVTQYTWPGQGGNPDFTQYGYATITKNRSTSSYNSLQVQFQRQLSHGLQALVSYTWSHSIDETSTNFQSNDILRGNSDYDIRHNFQAALTYDIPWNVGGALIRSALAHWSLDGRLTARSALPVDIEGNTVVAPDGSTQFLRANLVPGQPLYLYGSEYPGGKIINYNAFTTPTVEEQTAGDYGDAPRNFLRAFGATQLDTALQRRFRITEKVNLVFRAEAFNLFNHPNFGAIQSYLSDGPGVFGYSYNTLNSQLGGLNPLYQIGGPRSMQLALRLQF